MIFMLVIYKHKNNKSIIYFARKVWIYLIRILWRKSKERQKKDRKINNDHQNTTFYNTFFFPFETDQFLFLAMWDFLFSLLRQTSSSCTSARQKNHVRFTGKCMLCSLCQLPSPPPSQLSMLFLFKINNSLYISFQSFINTQILTISHIIT
jgi:hypothetical protein